MVGRFFVVFVSCVSAACGATHTTPRDDGGPEDTFDPDGSDGSADVSDTGPDAPDGDAPPLDADEALFCGDERMPLDVPPQPVVNGSDTFDPDVVDLSEGQMLAVGALLLRYWGNEWMNSCTATLISPNVVLTAAHCVTDESGMTALPREVRFGVGEDVATPVHMFPVARVFPHPDYGPGQPGSREDIAFLVLTEPATAVLPEIEIIPPGCEFVPTRMFLTEAVQNVGYGMTDPYDNWPPNTRRWWVVEHVSSYHNGEFEVNGQGVAGVCFGDSGGPSLWTVPEVGVRVMGVASRAEDSCVDSAVYALVRESCHLLDQLIAGCGDVTTQGSCDGDTAIYCESDTVMQINCPELDAHCGLDDQNRYRCIERIDPCQGETAYGRCVNNVAIFCTGGVVHGRDCSRTSRICGPDDRGFHRCLDDPCNGLDWEGGCQGETAVWCDGSAIRRRQCADCGQACGWSPEHQGFYCL